MRALTLLSILLLSLAPVQAQEPAQLDGTQFWHGLTALCVYAVAAEQPWTPLAGALLSLDERVQCLVARVNSTQEGYRWKSDAVPFLIECLSPAPYSPRPSPTPAAVRRVPRPDGQGVRWRAVIGLGMLGDASAVPALIECLSDEYENVRYLATLALRLIADPSAGPALTQCLSDEDEHVREEAARALGQIGGPAAVPALLERRSDKDSMVRNAVAWALGEIGDTSVVPALEKMLDDERPFVGRGAEQAIAKLCWTVEEAIARLRDGESGVADVHTRLTAVKVLGKRGDASAVPSLVEALTDETQAVCTGAARALGDVGDPSVVPELVRLLDHDEKLVRSAAVYALHMIGDPAAIPALESLLYDKSGGGVRHAVQVAIAEIRAAQGED